MTQTLAGRAPTATSIPPAANLRPLRVVLALQIALGLLWGISELFFARAVLGPTADGGHVEKMALEGAAHLALVFAALLVWRHPARARDLLLLMIALNALWTATDLVYIPLLNLTEWDFFAKLIVNATLAIGLAVSGRRAGIL